MIRLQRGPAPAILTSPFSDGRTETRRAIDHYTVGWNGKTSYSCKRYSEDDVRRALDAMCPGKCAYCESRIHVVSHEDVEHWRPKSSVLRDDGSVIKPGYYWLGAEWTNLLPSCPHCNRRSRKDLDAPGGAMSGKQDLFPVADERRRWRRDQPPAPEDFDAPNEEEPLLLDPCGDLDPGDHFVVLENGAFQEKAPIGTAENQRARHSIDVYGLNRPDLVAERLEHRTRLIFLLNSMQRGVRSFEEATTEQARADARQGVRETLEQLATERDPKSPYLFLKRPLIDKFMSRMGPELVRLGLP